MEIEASEGETERLFSSSSKSRDLLLRFSGRYSPDEAEEGHGSDSDEIELGLSLGGCFNSADHKNRILRTSSIPAIVPCEALPLFPLFRTCSLPEEEMQIMARMEAKRKRELKEGPDLKSGRFEVKNEGSWVRGGGPANGASSPVASRWIAGAGLPSPLKKGIAPAELGSTLSEGSNSSGGSELESRSGQGFELYGFINHASEIRSPTRFKTTSEHNNRKAPPFSPFSATPISKRIISSNGLGKSSGERCSNGELISKSMMKEMPLVSTKGDGPNSRRIEGFLYKYGRGEEVRIVCVCHGSFLTPAEFVKHAGGGEVDHPLRHIVVNPNPAALS